MKKWIKPSVKIVVLDEEDIIVTSTQVNEERNFSLRNGQLGGDVQYED